jgi:hypothetical protein
LSRAFLFITILLAMGYMKNPRPTRKIRSRSSKSIRLFFFFEFLSFFNVEITPNEKCRLPKAALSVK